MSYILNPKYGDMSVVVLGSSVKKIKKSLKENHALWCDFFDFPELNEEDEEFEKIKNFLNKDHKNPKELADDYNQSFDEDFIMEENY